MRNRNDINDAKNNIIFEQLNIIPSCIEFGKSRLQFTKQLIDTQNALFMKTSETNDEHGKRSVVENGFNSLNDDDKELNVESNAEAVLLHSNLKTMNTMEEEEYLKHLNSLNKKICNHDLYFYHNKKPQHFEREPFTTHYEKNFCGDPVFCDHAVEFQRRIFSWQFPEHKESKLGEVPNGFIFNETVVENVAAVDNKNDNNNNNDDEENGIESTDQNDEQRGYQEQFFLDENVQNDDNNDEFKNIKKNEEINNKREHVSTSRMCENSKFLIFEPPSVANGIGSMFELIAQVFRYAICLNRILMLNPIDEHKTLLKWKHDGCQESTFDCYFQPITDCIIDEKTIRNSFLSSNGKGFDEYPLKNHKVLKLNGLPSYGPCVICNDEMNENLEFFDGLFIEKKSVHVTLSEFSIDEKQKDLIHMRSFMSSI